MPSEIRVIATIVTITIIAIVIINIIIEMYATIIVN